MHRMFVVLSTSWRCSDRHGVYLAQSRGYIYRSEYTAERPQGYPTATHWLAEHTRPHADKIALVDSSNNKDVTFSELFRRAFNFGHGLRERGFRQGDVYMSLLPNTIEFLVAMLGVIAAGGVFSSLNPANKKDEVQRAMDLVKPSFFHIQSKLAVEVGDVGGMNPHLKVLIADEGSLEGSIPFDDFLNSETHPPSLLDDFDPKTNTSLILFSSGTTGVPKGVQISSSNIVGLVCSQCHPRNWDIRSADTLLSVFPFFHAGGLVFLLRFLSTGCSVIFMPSFEINHFLQTIEKFKPTAITVPPTLGRVLLSHPLVSNYDISSIKRIFTGGAPVRENFIRQLSELFNGATVDVLYGMSEAPLTHDTVLRNAPPGSVGQIMPGIECKIVSLEDERELGHGEQGEVRVRGDTVMLGYYGNPGATVAGFDFEGYWRTGDVGYCDVDGNLFIVDRIKELIKSKGFQVAPAELEDLLLRHEAVADVGVVGVPHKEDELVRAYIVRKPGIDVTEEDIKKYVAEKVIYYKHLRGGVRFIKGIPKLPSGKILRRVLREMAKIEND